MKKYLKWGFLFIILFIAVIGIWVVTNPKAALETFVDVGGIKEGEKIPLIKGTEVNGDPISLEQYKGKKFVVMIGRVDCEVCKKTYPVLKGLKEKHPSTNFVMIGKGDKNAYDNTKRENGFEFPIILADTKISEEMNFKIFPVFYLVNKDGKIEQRMNGFDESELQEILRKAEEK